MLNAAAIDCNATQLKQLAKLFNQLVVDTSGTEGDDLSAAITVAAQA